jgi:tRNA (Thr-GGU) A37 N-methylase
LWIQFVFHANRRDTWKPRVKAPRLGGNKTLGVFATRSPTRPAPIGLSVVINHGLIERDGKWVLSISGMDLLDGTPVLDIKPYVPYADCVPEAVNRFADAPPPLLAVHLSEKVLAYCSTFHANSGTDLQGLIVQVLQQDPRPSYQAVDPNRVYGIKLLSVDVRFRYDLIEGHPQIFVVDVVPLAD